MYLATAPKLVIDMFVQWTDPTGTFLDHIETQFKISSSSNWTNGPDVIDNQAVFRVVTNQVTNRYLKNIFKQASISKKITLHCARHTFATLSKSLGIEYDVISKILGHTDIKTTKIYTKYELDFLSREMGKWDIS